VGSSKRVALLIPYIRKTGLITHAEVLAGTLYELPIDMEDWDVNPHRKDILTDGSEGTGGGRAIML
jgi:hypothetical protein